MSAEQYTREDLDGLIRSKSNLAERVRQIDARMTAIAVLTKSGQGGSFKGPQMKRMFEERDALVKEKVSLQADLSEKNAIIRKISQVGRGPHGHEPGWVTMPELAAKVDRVEALLKTLLGRFEEVFGAVEDKLPSEAELSQIGVEG